MKIEKKDKKTYWYKRTRKFFIEKTIADYKKGNHSTKEHLEEIKKELEKKYKVEGETEKTKKHTKNKNEWSKEGEDARNEFKKETMQKTQEKIENTKFKIYNTRTIKNYKHTYRVNKLTHTSVYLRSIFGVSEIEWRGTLVNIN